MEMVAARVARVPTMAGKVCRGEGGGQQGHRNTCCGQDMVGGGSCVHQHHRSPQWGWVLLCSQPWWVRVTWEGWWTREQKSWPLSLLVTNLPAMQETWVRSLDWEYLLEEGMATHSNIPTWRIPRDRGAWQATVYVVVKSRT